MKKPLKILEAQVCHLQQPHVSDLQSINCVYTYRQHLQVDVDNNHFNPELFYENMAGPIHSNTDAANRLAMMAYHPAFGYHALHSNQASWSAPMPAPVASYQLPAALHHNHDHIYTQVR